MYLDADVHPSYHFRVMQLLFVLLMLVLSLFAALAWWQYLFVLILALICLFWKNNLTICSISTSNPKELWQLGIAFDDEIEMFEAYLNRVQLMDFGFLVVLKLDFYFDEPSFAHQSIFLFNQNLSVADFRKLTTLAKFGGY